MAEKQLFTKKVRIELHLSEGEAKIIDLMSEKDGRSRKNWCENVIRNEIFAGYVKRPDKASNYNRKNNENRATHSA